MDFFIRDDNELYSEEEESEFMNNYMMARGFLKKYESKRFCRCVSERKRFS